MGLQKLKIIGNGDAFGSGNRFHTCFYLESDKTKVLVDCGATSIHHLIESGTDLNDIDLILLSHFHGDHFGGIPFFLLNSFFLSGRIKPLTIIGPEQCETRIEALTEAMYPGLTKKFRKMDLTYLEYNKTINFNDLEIRAFPVVHSPPSNPHGIRVESGNNVFGYSGDTEWTDNLYDLSLHSDIFICECNYYDLEVRGHLNYKILRDKLNKIKSRRIMLTHMGEDMINSSQIELERTVQDQEYNF